MRRYSRRGIETPYCEHCGATHKGDAEQAIARLYERVLAMEDRIAATKADQDDVRQLISEIQKVPSIHKVSVLQDQVELYRRAAESMVRRVIVLEAKVGALRGKNRRAKPCHE